MPINAVIPEAWTEPGVSVPKGWIRDAEAIARERAEAVLLVSEKAYRRPVHAHADCNAFGLYPLGAKLRRAPGPDWAFHIVIPGGRRPHVLARHLRRAAPYFAFFTAVECGPDEPGNVGA